jgi:hypothetical protein
LKVGSATEANTKSKNIEANFGDCERITPISAIVCFVSENNFRDEKQLLQNREQSFCSTAPRNPSIVRV